MATPFTERLIECLSVPVQPYYPVSVAFDNANAITVPPSGDGVDMSKFRRVIGRILMGVGTPNNGTAKILGYWTGSNTNNGTYTAFATNTTTSINTNNSTADLELRSDQMPAGNRYVKFNVLVPVANAILSAEIVAGASHYSPGAQLDFSTNTSLLSMAAY